MESNKVFLLENPYTSIDLYIGHILTKIPNNIPAYKHFNINTTLYTLIRYSLIRICLHRKFRVG